MIPRLFYSLLSLVKTPRVRQLFECQLTECYTREMAGIISVPKHINRTVIVPMANGKPNMT